MDDKVSLAFNTTAVGLFIVFSALIILALFINLFGKVMGLGNKPKSTVKNNDEASVLEVAEDNAVDVFTDTANDDELVAILTAAVLASMKDRAECNIKIKSFRRLPQQAPAWNTAGRMEYIAGKL